MLRRVAKVPGGRPLPLLGGVGRLDVCVAVGLGVDALRHRIDLLGVRVRIGPRGDLTRLQVEYDMMLDGLAVFERRAPAHPNRCTSRPESPE